jgi:hypothetical protein
MVPHPPVCAELEQDDARVVNLVADPYGDHPLHPSLELLPGVARRLHLCDQLTCFRNFLCECPLILIGLH